MELGPIEGAPLPRPLPAREINSPRDCLQISRASQVLNVCFKYVLLVVFILSSILLKPTRRALTFYIRLASHRSMRKIPGLLLLGLMPRRKGAISTSRPFDTLPLEIIQHLASCLPANAAAAFALCNYHLSQAVGTQYWTNLCDPCQSKELEIFLKLLDRDLPDHLFCHHHARIHLSRWEDAD